MKKAAFLVLFLFVIIYMVPNAFRPIHMPDEARYAEVPREMIESGDWLVPRMGDVRYFEKTPMFYWTTGLSMLAFGQNNFALRFTSAASAGLIALFIFLFVRRFRKNSDEALLAAVIWLLSPFAYVIGVTAITDSLVSMFLTGAFISFYTYYQWPKEDWKRWLPLIMFGVFCGLAFLTKGFLAFVVTGVALFAFLIWERRPRELVPSIFVPLLTVLVLVGPWALAIHLREPDFWRFFVMEEHLGRFFAQNDEHKHGPFYLIPMLVIALLPMFLLAPLWLKGIKQRIFSDSMFRYCFCWFLFPFLFFSISGQKIATYILPCLPPLIVIISAGLYASLSENSFSNYINKIIKGLLILVVITAAGLVINFTTGFPQSLYFSDQIPALIFGLIIMGLIILVAYSSLQRETSKEKLIGYLLIFVLIYIPPTPMVPTRIIERKFPENFFRKHIDKIMENTTVISNHHLYALSSWVFKRNDVYLYLGSGDLRYGLAQPDSRKEERHFETPEALAKYINSFVGKQEDDAALALILNRHHWNDLEKDLPEPSMLDKNKRSTFAIFKAQ